MKAAVYHRYGGPEVVQLAEVATPAPGAGEVLIEVHAATVTSADWRARSMTVPKGFRLPARLVFGLFRPRKPVLGTELAGVITAVGSGVRAFHPGDEVFAFAGAGLGCHAEFRTIPETGMVLHKPANLSMDEAAALSFGGTTALYFLRDRAGVQPGERVLIVGASGAVGTAAVQLAKHFGAKVTGVCSGTNAAMVTGLGAERVIDYTRRDFTTEGTRYDVILDTTGTMNFARCKGSLAPGGRLALIAAGLPDMLNGLWANVTGKGQVILGVTPERRDDMRKLAELAEAGQFRPVIDRVFPLAQIREAHAYVGKGHKKGNVVIRMDSAT